MVRYWDWTLDWQDLRSSPVWDTQTGFGGDGDPGGDVVTHNGRCVRSGPFADMVRAYSATSSGHSHHSDHVNLQPHCLSRGFATGDLLEKIRPLISPQTVSDTLKQRDYFSFFAKFETGSHNAIPQFIHGDFLTFTAPNGMLPTPLSSLHDADGCICRSYLLATSYSDRSFVVALAAA